LSTIHVLRNSLVAGQPATILNAAKEQSIELVRLGPAITGTDMLIVDTGDTEVAEKHYRTRVNKRAIM